MWARLTDKQPLPPSQVVRTVLRGSLTTPPLTLANLPPIQSEPAEADRIVFTGNQLQIPD